MYHDAGSLPEVVLSRDFDGGGEGLVAFIHLCLLPRFLDLSSIRNSPRFIQLSTCGITVAASPLAVDDDLFLSKHHSGVMIRLLRL